MGSPIGSFHSAAGQHSGGGRAHPRPRRQVVGCREPLQVCADLATRTSAVRCPTPGMVSNCATIVLTGCGRPAISALTCSMRSSGKSRWSRCCATRKRWCGPNRPTKARSSWGAGCERAGDTEGVRRDPAVMTTVEPMRVVMEDLMVLS
jgi:hypothetical protein